MKKYVWLKCIFQQQNLLNVALFVICWIIAQKHIQKYLRKKWENPKNVIDSELLQKLINEPRDWRYTIICLSILSLK